MPTKILFWQCGSGPVATEVAQSMLQLKPWSCFESIDILQGTLEQAAQHCQTDQYSLLVIPVDEQSPTPEAVAAAIPGPRVIMAGAVEASADGSQLSLGTVREPELLRGALASLNPQRSIGVKYFLEKGSTVYYNTFFPTLGLGAKLDACHAFFQRELGQSRSLIAWNAVYNLLLMGLRQSSVDVQFGSDERQAWGSVVFSLTSGRVNENAFHMMNQLELRLARELAPMVDTRVLENSEKLEISIGFSKKLESSEHVSFFRLEATEALEDQAFAACYKFRHIEDAAGELGAEQKTKKRGFQNRTKGEEPQAADAVQVVVKDPNPELQQEIDYLKKQIALRDEMLAKLNKDVAELKNPEKWQVITGIQDTQKEGLKDNIDRLKQDVEFLEKEKKQLLSLADQAVRVRDQSQQQSRGLEVKFRQQQESYTTRIQLLEKQVDDLSKQKQALVKQVSELSEKLKQQPRASGKKAA